MKIKHIFLFFLLALIGACSDNSKKDYDLIIRNGLIYDGSGNAPISSDIAINGSFIALIGDLSNSTAEKEVNAEGMAVVPGFINVLSWATQPLIIDGRAMSDIKQGVTLEIMGEGRSMGPSIFLPP